MEDGMRRELIRWRGYELMVLKRQKPNRRSPRNPLRRARIPLREGLAKSLVELIPTPEFSWLILSPAGPSFHAEF